MKVASVLMAIGLWSWVQSAKVVESHSRAQLQYSWPETLLNVEEVPRSITITLSGSQRRLRALEHAIVSIPIDLSSVKLGLTTVDLSKEKIIGLPEGLEIVQFSPPQLDIQFDRPLTRPVKVSAPTIGEPADGFVVDSIVLEPSTVEITGPQSLLRHITEIQTDLVDINEIESDTVILAPLALPVRTTLAKPSGPLKVKVDISALVVTRTFSDVPVLPRGTGWRAVDETVSLVLEGPENAIRSISI